MRDDDGGYDAGISHGAEFSCGRLRAREFDWRRAGDATTTAATVDVGELRRFLLLSQAGTRRSGLDEPIVIRRLAESWEGGAWNQSSLSSLLRRFPYFKGKVRLRYGTNETEDRFVYSEDEASQRDMTLLEFCARLLLTARRSKLGLAEQNAGYRYYLQATMPDEMQAFYGGRCADDRDIWRLLDDIGYEVSQPPRLWVSAGGSVTPLHYDSSASILVQTRGSKLVKLYPPSPSVFAKMRLFPNRSPNRRRGGVPDLGNDTGAYVVHLCPGDALLFPPRWPHHVETLTGISVSVTKRFRVPQRRAPCSLDEVRRRRLASPIREIRDGGRHNDAVWGPVVLTTKSMILSTLEDVEAIFVRGSLASGYATPFVSDVDLVVVLGAEPTHDARSRVRDWLELANASSSTRRVATKIEVQMWTRAAMTEERVSILTKESVCVYSRSKSAIQTLLEANATARPDASSSMRDAGLEHVEEGMRRLRIREVGDEEAERIAKFCLKRSIRSAYAHVSISGPTPARIRCLFESCEGLVAARVPHVDEPLLAAALVAAVRGPRAAWGDAWRRDCFRAVNALVQVCLGASE